MVIERNEYVCTIDLFPAAGWRLDKYVHTWFQIRPGLERNSSRSFRSRRGRQAATLAFSEWCRRHRRLAP